MPIHAYEHPDDKKNKLLRENILSAKKPKLDALLSSYPVSLSISGDNQKFFLIKYKEMMEDQEITEMRDEIRKEGPFLFIPRDGSLEVRITDGKLKDFGKNSRMESLVPEKKYINNSSLLVKSNIQKSVKRKVPINLNKSDDSTTAIPAVKQTNKKIQKTKQKKKVMAKKIKTDLKERISQFIKEEKFSSMTDYYYVKAAAKGSTINARSIESAGLMFTKLNEKGFIASLKTGAKAIHVTVAPKEVFPGNTTQKTEMTQSLGGKEKKKTRKGKKRGPYKKAKKKKGGKGALKQLVLKFLADKKFSWKDYYYNVQIDTQGVVINSRSADVAARILNALLEDKLNASLEPGSRAVHVMKAKTGRPRIVTQATYKHSGKMSKKAKKLLKGKKVTVKQFTGMYHIPSPKPGDANFSPGMLRKIEIFLNFLKKQSLSDQIAIGFPFIFNIASGLLQLRLGQLHDVKQKNPDNDKIAKIVFDSLSKNAELLARTKGKKGESLKPVTLEDVKKILARAMRAG